MSKTFRSIADSNPVFVEVMSKTDTDDKGGVLYVNKDDRFEFKWKGKSGSPVLSAEFSGGYVRFENMVTGTIFDSLTTERTVHPDYLLYSSNKKLIDAKSYDQLRVTFNNTFIGIKQDIHKHNAVDILKTLNLPALKYAGMKMSAYIGGSVTYTTLPKGANYQMDQLIFEFTGKGRVKIDEVPGIVRNLQQVITLFTKVPCDPIAVEVGLRNDKKYYDHASYEYGVPGRYEKTQLIIPDAIGIEQGGQLLHAVIGLLSKDPGMSANQWFGYCESRHNNYYLDTIMSNLLSCAESIFYLLPPTLKANGRAEQYDKMLEFMRGHSEKIDKDLLKWLGGKKRDYEEMKPYAEKIAQLMKYCELEVKGSDTFRQYLNQLRNQLMHGTKPNWATVTINKDGQTTDVPISIGEMLRRLEAITQKSLIKWLTD